MPSPSLVPSYDAVVLSGGTSSRLDGVDKATLDVAGTSLLHRALETCAAAASRVVVGPHDDLPRGVARTREDPPGGGPVAAVAAGLGHGDAVVVVVLACDMPFVGRAQLERLVGLVAGAEAAVLVDETGRRQPLAAAYDRRALTAAIDRLDSPHGAPMHRLLQDLTVHEVAADAGSTTDCDTWSRVHLARRRLEHP